MLDVSVQVTHDGKLIAEHESVRVTLLPNLSFRDVTIPGFDKLTGWIGGRRHSRDHRDDQ